MDTEAGHRWTRMLREAPELANPSWTIDFGSAPAPFKIYVGGRRIQLGAAGLTWCPSTGAERAVARLLFHAAGCTRIRRSDAGLVARGVQVRRAIAAGGALYPVELYVYVRAADPLPVGVYHYDPARHQLTELRSGGLDGPLARALGRSSAAELGEVAVFLTVCFWKDYFKYGDFSYRLSAVDAGVALARVHRVGAAELGAARVHLDLDDAAVNEVLGVDGRDESVYAAVVLGRPRAVASAGGRALADAPLAAREVPRLATVRRSAEFDAMHASALAAGGAIRPRLAAGAEPGRVDDAAGPGERLALAPVARDLARQLHEWGLVRSSLGRYFTGDPVSAATLGTVVAEMHAALTRLAAASPDPELPAQDVFVVVLAVAGVPPGAYRYDASDHALRPIRTGRFGLDLQAAQRADNINVDLCAFVAHIVDHLDLRTLARGNRGHRVQHMFAGAALDGAMLASTALAAAAHPILGFRAAAVDALYGLAGTDRGALAQVCVGRARSGAFLESSVVS